MATLTTTEAARRCGVCPRTVLRWLDSGELPGTRTLGGHWRVDESVLPVPSGAARPGLTQRGRGGLRVVVIEDDPNQAQALVNVLALLAPGASSERAADGLSAGLLLGATLPHIAFVDIEMPGLDGIEVIRRARQVGSLNATHFVVVSGRLTPARVAALTDLGVRDILRKPIDPEAIRLVMAEYARTDGQKEAS